MVVRSFIGSFDSFFVNSNIGLNYAIDSFAIALVLYFYILPQWTRNRSYRIRLFMGLFSLIFISSIFGYLLGDIYIAVPSVMLLSIAIISTIAIKFIIGSKEELISIILN